jgi:hypothetical protein
METAALLPARLQVLRELEDRQRGSPPLNKKPSAERLEIFWALYAGSDFDQTALQPQ